MAAAGPPPGFSAPAAAITERPAVSARRAGAGPELSPRPGLARRRLAACSPPRSARCGRRGRPVVAAPWGCLRGAGRAGGRCAAPAARRPSAGADPGPARSRQCAVLRVARGAAACRSLLGAGWPAAGCFGAGPADSPGRGRLEPSPHPRAGAGGGAPRSGAEGSGTRASAFRVRPGEPADWACARCWSGRPSAVPVAARFLPCSGRPEVWGVRLQRSFLYLSWLSMSLAKG